MNVTFDHAEEVAQDIRTFWFRPERPVRYIAGQFTELYLPHEADERGIRRWFTLSSSPTEELVAITTKFASKEGSSYKKQLAALRPGAQLKLADPMGDFVLPKDPTIPLVFVAAGLGITPIRSMIKWLTDRGERRTIHLVYAATTAKELAFMPLFRAYDLRLTPIVKIPDNTYDGTGGSLTSNRILELTQEQDNSLVYLSGPEPMVETFFKELQSLGVASERLVTDYFPGYVQF